VEEFSKELLRLMGEKGLTQTQVAAACGVGQTFVSKLLRCERAGLGADVYIRLCRFLGVPLEHFAGMIVPPVKKRKK
jgi:transcriptional regulator with XRE-family HTH domain